jgi:hypothetical protein
MRFPTRKVFTNLLTIVMQGGQHCPPQLVDKGIKNKIHINLSLVKLDFCLAPKRKP